MFSAASAAENVTMDINTFFKWGLAGLPSPAPHGSLLGNQADVAGHFAVLVVFAFHQGAEILRRFGPDL